MSRQNATRVITLKITIALADVPPVAEAATLFSP